MSKRAVEVFRSVNLTGGGYVISASRRVYWPGGHGKFVGKWNVGGGSSVQIGPVMTDNLTTLYAEIVPFSALVPVAGVVDVILDFDAPECLIDFSAHTPGSVGDSLTVYDLRLVPTEP